MKLGIRLLVFTMLLALLAVPVACGGTPEELPTAITTPPATETPSVEPTATATPTTETPTAEPTKEPDFTEISAEILGQTVDFNIGQNAAVWSDVTAASPDGKITFTMPWGTKLADADGNPITELSATINENPAQPESGVLLGPTVTFQPDSTYIDLAVEVEFDYSDYLDLLGDVPEEDIAVAQYVVKNDAWAPMQMSQVDVTNHKVKVSLDRFFTDFTIGVLAKKKVVVEDTGAPENGINVVIDFVSKVKPDTPATLTIQTVPNASVLTWWVLPDTGTRTTRPTDRQRVADENGKVTWEFTLSTRTHAGEGRYEFYVTTNTDPEFLAAFNAGRLDTIYPDLADAQKKFQNGEIPTLEYDAQTTARWFLMTVE